jgi:hypothetical protein
MTKVEAVTELKEKLDKFITLNVPTYKDEDENVWFATKFLNKGYVKDDDPIELLEVDPECPVHAMSYELSSYLITSHGQADHEAHRQLRAISNGDYRVIAGEKDLFGRLSGILITPKGRICYG